MNSGRLHTPNLDTWASQQHYFDEGSDTYAYYVERARQRLIKRKVLRVVRSCVTGEHCKVAHEMINLARPMLSFDRNHEINAAYLRKILNVTGVVDEGFDA